MRNIFIGFLCGASYFLILVQSTTFPGSYLTGRSEYQKFSDFDQNGVIVNYQIVPLNVVGSRVRRQAPSAGEQKNAENVKQMNPAKKQISDPVKSVVTSVAKSNEGPTNTTAINSSPASTNTNSSVITNSTLTTTPATNSLNNTNSSTNGTIPSNDEDDIYPQWPSFNKTITAPNSTQYQVNVSESHKYYDSNFISNGSMYWLDLSQNQEVQEHELLSNSHRRAATIQLKFKFPFYGQKIGNVTVATGGFIYLGEHVHAWLAATQYVAPLMANFDSSKSTNASVRFLSTNSSFTVEWSQVPLQDSPDKGPFTFEASLYENGTIVFAYKSLPIDINDIQEQLHPVKVGLSDAYIRDKNVLFVKQKTIYEYDRVDLRTNRHNITNGTAIIFNPKRTCLLYKNCTECAKHETDFECTWCPSVSRCSDGTDRQRHDWLNNGCDKGSLKTLDQCLAHPDTYNTYNTTPRSSISDNHGKIDNGENRDHGDQAAVTKQLHHDGGSGMGAAGVIGVLILVILIVTGVGWIFYAYIFPHSTSGQLLIRYRPSQWSFNRRRNCTYTAASIHM